MVGAWSPVTLPRSHKNSDSCSTWFRLSRVWLRVKQCGIAEFLVVFVGFFWYGLYLPEIFFTCWQSVEKMKVSCNKALIRYRRLQEPSSRTEIIVVILRRCGRINLLSVKGNNTFSICLCWIKTIKILLWQCFCSVLYFFISIYLSFIFSMNFFLNIYLITFCNYWVYKTIQKQLKTTFPQKKQTKKLYLKHVCM